jgi:hypothetical protein
VGQEVQSIGEACRPALMKDVLQYVSTNQQRYSYFAQIDEKTFHQLRIDAEAGASVPIPLIGEMVEMIRASASYTQFVEKRREYLQRVGYSSDSAREVRDLRIVTSPVAYSSWTKCIESLAAERRTLAVWKVQEDESTVQVRIVNRTPVTVRLTTQDLLNATVSGQQQGKVFKDRTPLGPNGTMGVLLQRAGRGGLRLSINSDPPFDNLFVESEWAQAPTRRLSGQLRLTLASSRVEERGPKRGQSWTSPNLHNKKCEREPCSSDGKWQLSKNTITVAADGGLYLKNPRSECDDNPEGDVSGVGVKGSRIASLRKGDEELCAPSSRVVAGTQKRSSRISMRSCPSRHRLTQYRSSSSRRDSSPCAFRRARRQRCSTMRRRTDTAA